MHIKRENENRYKSNNSAVVHTDATSHDVIDRITTFIERKSMGFLTEAMVIGDGIIKEVDVVDVLLDTCPGNNKLTGTGWSKKVNKCNNVSTTMLVKLYVDELLYHILPLKDVNKLDILSKMNSYPLKKRKIFDNLVKKNTKKHYLDNEVHKNIEPKLQNMSTHFIFLFFRSLRYCGFRFNFVYN